MPGVFDGGTIGSPEGGPFPQGVGGQPVTNHINKILDRLAATHQERAEAAKYENRLKQPLDKAGSTEEPTSREVINQNQEDEPVGNRNQPRIKNGRKIRFLDYN
jgi:hypothetical protein